MCFSRIFWIIARVIFDCELWHPMHSWKFLTASYEISNFNLLTALAGSALKKYFSFSSTLLFEIIWIKEKSERRRMRFISRWGMSEDLFTSSQLNESFENKIKYNFLSRQKALQIQFKETTENFPLGHCVICSFIVNLEIQLFIVFQVPKWM